MITGIEVHPAANIFPLMDEESLAKLADDIHHRGQEESCVLWQGKLLDGRNRWLACQKLGIDPETCELEEDDIDPVQYVLSANLHRRQLTESQRALVAVRVEEFYKEPAKQRQKAGLKKGQQIPVPENLPERGNLVEAMDAEVIVG